jgi:hypothetical protein
VDVSPGSTIWQGVCGIRIVGSKFRENVYGVRHSQMSVADGMSSLLAWLVGRVSRGGMLKILMEVEP